MADARDLKSLAPLGASRFESGLRHQIPRLTFLCGLFQMRGVDNPCGHVATTQARNEGRDAPGPSGRWSAS